MNRRLLVVDDEPSLLSLLRDELGCRGYSVSTQTSPHAALQLLADDDFGAVICDVRMQGMNGIELCREIVALRVDVPVIIITGFASIESAVGAIRAGAFDFVTKPFHTDDLIATIERALERRSLHQEVSRLRQARVEHAPIDAMIGDSAPMQRLYAVLSRVAETDATAIITGESGTGKELVAQALHSKSARCSGPFVAVSCAAMPEALLESELFGHEKGAFTDAIASRPGLLLSASGGTLLLDEVGEMPLGIQAKLLRALQERKVRPVGSSKEVSFDTRLIAATNRDLEHEVAEGRFREDLFFRLNVVQVHLPPLRERGRDVLLLAQTFLQQCATRRRATVTGLTNEAAERLLSYPWPGNVRELQNCIERAVALSRCDQVQVDDLPERIRSHARSLPVCPNPVDQAIVSLEEMEKRHVTGVLHAMRGNKASAARALGLDRRTLYRMLERWRSSGGEPIRG